MKTSILKVAERLKHAVELYPETKSSITPSVIVKTQAFNFTDGRVVFIEINRVPEHGNGFLSLILRFCDSYKGPIVSAKDC